MNRIIVLLSFMLLLAACQQVGKDKSIAAGDGLSAADTENMEQLREMYHRFPSVDEMLTTINRNKKEYIEALINSADKSDEYLNSKSQALNLGVYSADLAYLTIHGKHSEAMVYFEALYELSDKLRVSAAFNRNLLRRIQDNITNADSLQSISEEAINELTEYLEINRNEKVFVLVSIGGFVEALYLSISLLDDYNEEAELVQNIADQKYVLDNIISYAGFYTNDPIIKSTLEDLQPLVNFYTNLDYIVEETNVDQEKDGKLLIHGGNKLVLSKEQFNELKEITTKLRINIVEY